jgi:ADP-heptose:LPS heptosyltransferase
MTPTAAAAKRIPGSRVAVVIEEPFQEVLLGNPNLDEVLPISRRTCKPAARIDVWRRIRRFRPDVTIDLHGGTTGALLTFVSGAGLRVGYAGSRNSHLYNVRAPDSRTVWGRDDLHTVEHQLTLLKYLGVDTSPTPPLTLPVQADSLVAADEALRKAGVSGEFVLIQPAAAFKTKQWPAERFAVVAKRLAEAGVTVVITAGPGEEQLLQEVRVRSAGSVRVVPPLPLREFAALVSKCRLYVGNDTGATHMAAALGRRIVVIFGSSDFRVWSPWRVEHRLVRSDLPCVPCPGYRCLHYPDPRCIRAIETGPVLEAIRELL